MDNHTSTLRLLIVQTVASIPAGKVASYGTIARLCGYATYARYVGTVLKQLPADTRLPWHRVINSKGEIAFPAGSEAFTRQQYLLKKEGIVINKGKIAMATYGWHG